MLEFTAPEITESINKLCYRWPAYKLRIIADRIDDKGKAELWFYHSNGKAPDALLHTASVNLLSTSTINQLIKRMETHGEETPWQQCLTYIAKTAVEYQRRGEPGIILEPVPNSIEPPGYFIEPLIMKGVPSIIFGDKGVNKTTIGLTCLGLISSGCDDSNLGLTSLTSAKVGLLDWESNQQLTLYTTSRLIAGNTIPYFQLPYLRCTQTLADDIERISNFIHDHQIEVVLIDSLGQAAGSDKFDSSGKASALRFFECLRQLKVTSLIIAQNSKSGESNQKTIYGSTYFTYYARNIFELRKSKETISDSEMAIALFHQDSNYSKKYEPIGFRISYTQSTIEIRPEVVSFAKFMEKISQPAIILDFLKNGAQPRAALMKLLNADGNVVSQVLNRLKKKGKIMELGSGMWGLATDDTED